MDDRLKRIIISERTTCLTGLFVSVVLLALSYFLFDCAIGVEIAYYCCMGFFGAFLAIWDIIRIANNSIEENEDGVSD